MIALLKIIKRNSKNKTNMRNVLVIGGHGFIGSHVVDKLAEKGINVMVFGREPNKAQPFMPKGDHEFFLGDVKDREAVKTAISLNDGVINLAGILGTSETVDDPYPSVQTNIVGALNVFEGIRAADVPGVQIVVGNHFMNNSYAITKTTAERFALMYNKEHGTRIAVVRGLNAYGPRQKHKPVRKIIPNFVIRAIKGEPIEIYGKGRSIMDMIHVEDLAEVLVRALTVEHETYDRVFEAGTGIKTTVNDIADVVKDLAGSKEDHKHIPMRAGEPEKSVVLGDPKTLKPLGKIKMRDLREGLQSTIQWYISDYPWMQDMEGGETNG